MVGTRPGLFYLQEAKFTSMRQYATAGERSGKSNYPYLNCQAVIGRSPARQVFYFLLFLYPLSKTVMMVMPAAGLPSVMEARGAGGLASPVKTLGLHLALF